MLGCVCVAGFYGQQLHAWSATADFTLRAREKMGSQEGCASNLGMRKRHKEPIIMPITCAASRFPRAYQHGKNDARGSENAPGSSGQLLWFVSTRRVAYAATRDTGVLRCRRRLISPLLSPRFGVSPDPQIGPATLRQGRGTKKDGFISQGREASPSIYGRKGGV